jgi:DNA invertase Pin-like site-specific DNA recombinase
LAECKKRRLTSVIAKLNRRARNVHFISGLIQSGADFVAVDMPHATRLTIHILTAVAEHEREMISQLTKTALDQARRRGRVLGNPRLDEAHRLAADDLDEAHRLAADVNRTNSPSLPVLDLMRGMRAQPTTGKSVQEVQPEGKAAAELQRRPAASSHP